MLLFKLYMMIPITVRYDLRSVATIIITYVYLKHAIFATNLLIILLRLIHLYSDYSVPTLYKLNVRLSYYFRAFFYGCCRPCLPIFLVLFLMTQLQHSSRSISISTHLKDLHFFGYRYYCCF